jgi:lipoprotein signal peptidase
LHITPSSPAGNRGAAFAYAKGVTQLTVWVQRLVIFYFHFFAFTNLTINESIMRIRKTSKTKT